jgi:predicted nucleic acid-binding protein
MRILFDTDVVLDLILAREPFAQDAVKLFDLAEKGVFEIYLSAITPLNIFYVARKATQVGDLRSAIKQLLERVGICSLDKTVLVAAFGLRFVDYEDAVQHSSATAAGIDAIVTRNDRDYKNSILPVYTHERFLEYLEIDQEE